MADLLHYLQQHQDLLVWLGVASLLTFVVSLLSLPWLVSRIPEDYFLPKKRQPSQWKEQRPLTRSLLLIGKNCLGAVLLMGGVLMLFLPGQGLLTIAMGLLLMDYPGKFRLERRIATMPAIFNGLNWLRAKAKHPPLRSPNS
ncbi:PGPGW domain-containing protein [Porticoccus sp. GXU_MW_L64]